jgi:IclR family transcriptional regulator, acetate operon repressor
MRSPADRDPEPFRGSVQAIDRAVSLLRCFSQAEPRLSLSELSRRTGLSTSTAFRLLTSLQENGVLHQVTGRMYQLGPLFLQLASTAMSEIDLPGAARPIMTELRDQTNETVGLHVLLPNLTRLVLDQVESWQPLRRTYTELGQPMALHLGAPGKVLLAYLPEADRESVLARPMNKATPATITDLAELRANLSTIVQLGYGVSLAERVAGVRTVAAPIRNQFDRVTACLSVSGPEFRMPNERLAELGTLAAQAGLRISRLLGARLDDQHGTFPDQKGTP